MLGIGYEVFRKNRERHKDLQTSKTPITKVEAEQLYEQLVKVQHAWKERWE